MQLAMEKDRNQAPGSQCAYIARRLQKMRSSSPTVDWTLPDFPSASCVTGRQQRAAGTGMGDGILTPGRAMRKVTPTSISTRGRRKRHSLKCSPLRASDDETSLQDRILFLAGELLSCPDPVCRRRERTSDSACNSFSASPPFTIPNYLLHSCDRICQLYHDCVRAISARVVPG
jgi:hypothetical protein